MYTVGLDVDKFVFTCEYIDIFVKILLYAGNSFVSSPLVFITIGTIYLLQYYLKGQSAGNLGFSSKANALAKNTYNILNNLPFITEHVPNHKTNLTDHDLGYFLAGLIEGSGSFNNNEISIVFFQKDVSLAYSIKKQIGFGKVYKDPNNLRYICNHTEGIKKILSLINGKFVTDYKHKQFIKFSVNSNITINDSASALNKITLDNYWLAGLTQARGNFRILSEKNNSSQGTKKNNSSKPGQRLFEQAETVKSGDFGVLLLYSLKYNDKFLLELIHDIFAKKGSIAYNTSKIWSYNSTDLINAANLINYFDRFNLFADKYKDFLKFRKVYIYLRDGKHISEKGIKRIISIARKGSSETSTQEV